MLNDTVDGWHWGYSKPILTGNSNRWKYFDVNVAELGFYFNVHDGDTILYKFSFISDGIQTNKDGLMFDDFHFEDWVEGIEEVGFGLFKSNCFPNPATNLLIIRLENDPDIIDIEVFDINGKRVLNKQAVNANVVEINISELNAGIYFYKVKNQEKKIYSLGKFIIG